ncbi:MAG: bifunctional DNA primase/polymerase, partial [Candidatus Heimdallarchaeota archaeon]
QGFVLDFLKKRNLEFTMKGKQFTCPFCKEQSANIFPPDSNKVHCFTPECGSLGDIFDLCRRMDFDNNKDIPDEDIADFLINEFSIQTNDNVEQLLAQYSEWGWDLVPVAPGGKASDRENNWQNKTHKDVKEWRQWLTNGLNMGVKGGKLSNTIIVDLDLVPSKLKKKVYTGKASQEEIDEAIKIKEEKLNALKALDIFDFDTAMQDTFGGYHLFYRNDEEITKCAFDCEGIHIDIQSDGGQAVIEPSTVGGYPRTIIGKDIHCISDKLKAYILENTQNRVSKKQEEDVTVSPEEGLIKGLEGICNQRFIEVGGMFRKFMNVNQMEQAIKIVNKQLLDDPMPFKSIKTMCTQIDKYHKADINTISEEILTHMKIVTDAHVRDLKECLGYDRKDLEQALRYLCDKRKLYKTKKDLYKFIEDTVWQEDFLSMSKPLSCTVPYFEDYNIFDDGSMIVIGAPSGTGKTHITVNMLQQFVAQGISPYLISTEAGSKFSKIAQVMRLKEGDFKYIHTNNPSAIPLHERSITIIDWLKAPNGEYNRTDAIYEQLNDQLVEKGGLLIVLAQLKNETKQFYAEDMVMFYASTVAKFLYPKKGETVDNTRPYFKTTKLRDSKVGTQYIDIPLSYDNETKILRKR